MVIGRNMRRYLICLGLLGMAGLGLAAGAPHDPHYLMVTGSPSPEATGLYVATNTCNGNTLYARQSDAAFQVWRSNTNLWTDTWVLSAVGPTGSWWASAHWIFDYHIIPVGPSTRSGGGASNTVTLTVYDPKNPTSAPVLVPVPVPVPAPTNPSRILVTGTLAPDATGYYNLGPTNYNGLPVWIRDGDGAFAIWGINQSIWRLSAAPGNTTAGMWKWDYRTPGKDYTTGSETYTGVAGSVYADPDFPTPGQHLAGKTSPVFGAGHTLPPLTTFGWGFSYELNKAMADWGYALDLGDATSSGVARISQPYTFESNIIALAQSDPARYKLSLKMARYYVDHAPDAAYCHDTNGLLISPKTFSPQAPDSVLSGLAATTTVYVAQVAAHVQPAVILNGGERGMGVFGGNGKEWKLDPTVQAAKGDLSWSDYQSQRKLHEEIFFTDGAHAAAPEALYVYYTAGGNSHRNLVFWGNWWLWDWDYRYLQPITDLPSCETYFKHGNTGWTSVTGRGTDGDDALTIALNGIGNATSFGKPLSYNWLCAGWAEDPASPGNSDLGLYHGFLKAYYTAGMIGGNAGYYRYPDGGFNAIFDRNAPPNWLLQIEALGQIHAEFSYLEDMLRDGDLLPGPMKHRWSREQPAYEFWTGFYNTRVLARKKRGEQRWLICAWAADAVPRTVNVTIPPLGALSLEARPAACLYDARIAGGVQTVTRIDDGSMTPAPLALPSETPDSDPSPYPSVALTAMPTNLEANVGDTVTLTAVPSNFTAPVTSTKFLADHALLSTNYASPVHAWSPAVTGVYSVVAVVGDADGNFLVSDPLDITIGGVSITNHPRKPGASFLVSDAALMLDRP